MTKVKAQKKSNSSNKDAPVITEQPRHSNGRTTNTARPGGGGYIQRVTNDDREDEMNENLE